MNRTKLILTNNFKIKIRSDHDTYLKRMKEEFSIHVPNYFFMGKYKSGMWDGKIHFITEAGMLPYGLLFDFIKAHKKLFPEIKLEADKGVKELFKNKNLKINYNLSWYPRPYQKEAIEICLKYNKGIIVSATASGKSLVISYIIKTLLNNRSKTKVSKCLIIVPSKALVNQFKSDMIEYGINEKHIGKVYAESKEWDKTIVISTWQTLKNNTDKLSEFNCIIGDEAHQVKAKELKKIFSKSKANYRFGFTGTMPIPITEQYTIKSYLGNVLREYPSGLLANEGYIAKCTVKAIKIEYPLGTMANDYKGIKDEIFQKNRRFEVIKKIINSIDDNILILVNYLEEGDKIVKLIRRYSNKTTDFLSGKDDVCIRERWRKRMMDEDNIALVATYGIMSTGINIKNLKYLMLASPTKSKIRTLQSIGRALRLSDNKKDGAIIFDIIDNVKYIGKHGEERLKYYEKEGHKIEYLEEKDFII